MLVICAALLHLNNVNKSYWSKNWTFSTSKQTLKYNLLTRASHKYGTSDIIIHGIAPIPKENAITMAWKKLEVYDKILRELTSNQKLYLHNEFACNSHTTTPAMDKRLNISYKEEFTDIYSWEQIKYKIIHLKNKQKNIKKKQVAMLFRDAVSPIFEYEECY